MSSNVTVDGERIFAHSRNEDGQRQGLRDHLEAVAALASEYAASFDSAEAARFAGLWHDLGKYHPAFQEYLLGSEAGTWTGKSPDHKAAGALFSQCHFPPLASVIAGHHGGLTDLTSLKQKLKDWGHHPQPAEALKRVPPELKAAPPHLVPPAHVRTDLDSEFWIRMLFSALVDADFLDTERHFQRQRSDVRETTFGLHDLWDRFAAHHASMPTRHTEVSRIRSDVYAACLQAASLPPGTFRLTVPTGGGKTLSGMGFALRHAIEHGLQRVIVAVPYTTITEQTADVYRQAFGMDRAVLEHHSALDPARVNDQTEAGLWGRLAAENWDAPIVVTTTVQLFQSLFGRSTSACRRLHRLAGSVIVLDEAQSLPPHLLEPILDALRALTNGYRASVLLCTATQPALDEGPGFKGLRDVTEIAPDPPRLFQLLQRVEYEFPDPDVRWTWGHAAEEMRQSGTALAVLNTIADSLHLFDTLDDPDALYLSTLLCGKHRREVLAEVRRRLARKEPCLLVTTQVVEAGVDIDFPVVLRAMGPLDRIVQAAGRCNREGLLDKGRVVVFQPEEGGLPRGSYRTATDIAAKMLRRKDVQLHDPALYTRYFRDLFSTVDLDSRSIQTLRKSFRYEEVAEQFRMIEDDTTSVFVPYDEHAEQLVIRLRAIDNLTRARFREMQPYMVAVRTHKLEEYRKRGLVEETRPGLQVWAGTYDRRRGLSAENQLLYV